MIKRLAVLLLTLLPLAAHAGPIFPTRGFLVHPKWYGVTDTTAVFDHGGYWAQLQRGFGSDSDRWGWSISMGATWEFARYGGNKSLFALTGMELIADTHNDITFNPHGAMWEEGLVYAVHETERFDWQLGAMYRCRHDIDNGDPGQYSDVFGGRTLIYCSLSGKAVWNAPLQVVGDSSLLFHLRSDIYLIREDYRIPAKYEGLQPDFSKITWSLGVGANWHLKRWTNSSLYYMPFINISSFSDKSGFFNRFTSIAKFVEDTHLELGYEFHGRAGRIQFYAGFERWEDDGQTPIPRNSQAVILGIRTTGTDLVTF
jgi:hypothetical protein